VERLERGFDVDEGARRQHELDLCSSGQPLSADAAAQFREQDAEPGAMVGRGLFAIRGQNSCRSMRRSRLRTR
jgi:hypothetical protein